ncbi:MAG TPA: RNA polymerase sigma factor [Vicinamibacteria bacterium]
MERPGAEEPPRIDASLSLAAVALAEGRDGALDLIWERCARELYGLALWRTGSVADAEDAVQEVFLKLARSPKALLAAARPRAYLLTMAHRAAVDQLRRRRDRPPEDATLFLAAPLVDPTRTLDGEHASRLVQGLAPKQRTAVFLKLFAGLTFEEVGRVTGVPTFTAGSRYRLAIGRLRRQMGVGS